MRSLLFAALFVAPLAAHASTRVISVETNTLRYASVEALNTSCQPGVAPNGHNYPTASSLDIHSLYYVMPIANTRSIGVNDPQQRLGNHCTELMSELAQALPGDLTVTRTISESITIIAGSCARTISEELVGKIGNFELVGSSGFIAEKLPESACAK
jgi:hypothetical protein